jgi:uncharacterized protein
VGRLDKASEGLLLMTNDTRWAQRVLDPASNVKKVYHVQIDRLPDEVMLEQLQAGMVLDGERLVATSASLLRAGARNAWLEMILSEGRTARSGACWALSARTCSASCALRLGACGWAICRGAWSGTSRRVRRRCSTFRSRPPQVGRATPEFSKECHDRLPCAWCVLFPNCMAGPYPRTGEGLNGVVDGAMMRLSLPVIILGALLMSTLSGFGSTNSPSPLDRQLITAAEQGDADAVRRALSEGASIDARDSRQRTALMAAAQSNHVAVARVLIEAGADVNAKDEIDDSPYLLAGARGYLEILRLTLSYGADLRSTNRYGGTALIPAAERGHVETVRTLIEAGVDVDHVNKLGWTGLLEAIILGDGGPRHIEIVRLLLDAGANANLADRDGVTPLQHARQRGYRAIERLLTIAGAR